MKTSFTKLREISPTTSPSPSMPASECACFSLCHPEEVTARHSFYLAILTTHYSRTTAHCRCSTSSSGCPSSRTRPRLGTLICCQCTTPSPYHCLSICGRSAVGRKQRKACIAGRRKAAEAADWQRQPEAWSSLRHGLALAHRSLLGYELRWGQIWG